MRCPRCRSDTAEGLPRCTRCNFEFPSQPAEPTQEDAPWTAGAAPGREPWPEPGDDRMPWPNADFPPFAQQPPQRRKSHGYAGWILTGVLSAAVFAAAGIVLWPGKEPAKGSASAGKTETPVEKPPAPTPTDTPPPTLQKFWVDTFAAADGYRDPDTSGDPVGQLRKGTNYVFCKRLGSRVERNGQYNHWWLLTNLDEVYSGGGARAYVPALYLTHWGNNEAKDNDGHPIPTCRP